VVVVVVVVVLVVMMMLMMMNVDVYKHVSALHSASQHIPTHPPASQDGPDTEQMRPPRARSMDEPDFKSACTDMTFSYDGTRFIVTSTDQTAKLYDACANTPPPPPSLPPSLPPSSLFCLAWLPALSSPSPPQLHVRSPHNHQERPPSSLRFNLPRLRRQGIPQRVCCLRRRSGGV
jgi:hypothetical protein